MTRADPFTRNVVTALIWLSAFFWAVGIFTSTRKFIDLDPTSTTVVGRVTIENASKSEDYARAAWFFIGVPLMTAGLSGPLRKLLTRFSPNRAPTIAGAGLYSIPFLLSPVIYLVTRKELWSVLAVPFAAALAGWIGSRSPGDAVRQRGTTALVTAEAIALLAARYLYTGRWIAHIHTLLLELTIVVLLITGLVALTILAARILASRKRGERTRRDESRLYHQLAIGMSPLLTLPLFAMFPGTTLDHPLWPITVFLIAGASAALLIARDTDVSEQTARAVALAAIPLLIFIALHASVSSLSGWVDLFHRGETLGPASDYLRGQNPYSDVLPLHGLLEDGLLDAWLMQIFGRSEQIAFERALVLSSLMIPLLWILSWRLFRSWRLTAATTILALIVSADNQRSLLVILTVILLIEAVGGEPGKMRSRVSILFAGAASTLGLFFSLETGIYSLVGSLIALVSLWTLDGRRSERHYASLALFYLGGAIAVSFPFVLFLASRGSLGAFFRETFVVIPSVIDPSWSIPYPDIGAWFAENIGSASLYEMARQFRYLFNPLIIGIALTWMVTRLRHRNSPLSLNQIALVIIAPIATLTQRSALGRADFNHQWFSAFLIAPLLVALVVELYRMWTETGVLSDRPTRAVVVVSSTLIVPIFLLALWSPGLLRQRLDSAVSYRARLLHSVSDVAGNESRVRIREVSKTLREIVRPDQALFDFSNQPAFYFYANRRNPTRYYQVPLMSSREHQIDAISDLERDPPAAVIMTAPERYHRFDGITNVQRATLVADWIRDRYAPSATVYGVEIWTPSKAGSPIGGDSLPADRVSNGERELVVPLVMRSPGADGLMWKTDLLLINLDLEATASLVLQLSTTEQTVTRTLRIDPADQRLFLDIVASLFDLESATGALFVSIEPDAPVDVLTRSTDEGGNRSPWARALSFSDRSGAHLDFPGLTPSANERVNVAVVNVGAGTAVVDLYLEVDGKPRGGHRLTIPERQTSMGIDLAKLLGESPSAEHPLRAWVSKGVVAASVSTLDPSTRKSETIAGVPREE